ncbi:MAG: hypothetical protein ABSA29_20710 [Terriglobales bacterium]|jgi:hypothetical protein
MAANPNFNLPFDSHSGEAQVDVPLCPRCASSTIRRSRRRSLRDRVMSLLSYLPYRCDECDLRFYFQPRVLTVAVPAK